MPNTRETQGVWGTNQPTINEEVAFGLWNFRRMLKIPCQMARLSNRTPKEAWVYSKFTFVCVSILVWGLLYFCGNLLHILIVIRVFYKVLKTQFEILSSFRKLSVSGQHTRQEIKIKGFFKERTKIQSQKYTIGTLCNMYRVRLLTKLSINSLLCTTLRPLMRKTRIIVVIIIIIFLKRIFIPLMSGDT